MAAEPAGGAFDNVGAAGSAASRVQATVKWFDVKKGFGFCTLISPDSVANAQAGEEEIAGADAAEPRSGDVFFSAEEAAAARGRGLALNRGEVVWCRLVADDRDSSRLTAQDLRPFRGGAAGASAESPEGRNAALDHLVAFAARVRGDIAPRLSEVKRFQAAAVELLAILREAWGAHAAAGRAALEAFVQGPCFDAVQGFERHALPTPELFSDPASAEAAAAFLGDLRALPVCWSPQQRRTLDELLERVEFERIECGDVTTLQEQEEEREEEEEACPTEEDACPTESDVEVDHRRIDRVLAQRTSRFVVLLEGVRNSANQLMILRTCEALGVQEVWIVPPPAGAKYRAAMVRSKHASRGAERLLTLRRFASVAEAAAACRGEGRELWATYCPSADADPAENAASRAEALEVGGSLPANLPRLVLALGTEGDGASEDLLVASDRWVYLPMFGFMQSLNVAVACGMLLQRLFDLCPSARGDLEPAACADLRRRLLSAAPRLGRGAAADRGTAADGVVEEEV